MRGYCSRCGELTEVEAVELSYGTEFLCEKCMEEREESYDIQKDSGNQASIIRNRN